MSALMATVMLLGAVQLPPAAPAPRDGAARDTATPAATGIIRGRVTDRESGQPLSRVMVVLLPHFAGEEPRPPRSAGTRFEPRMTLTSAEGRYEYKQVPAGTYVISFDPSEMRGTHLRQYFGEVEPANDVGGSRPPVLQLKDGEVRNDVNGALSRSLAIEGRVLDEVGEPMANVEVTAHPGDGSAQIQITNGRSTDDRGAFRLFGLKPGQYRICANPAMHFFRPTEDLRDRPIRTCYPATTVDADAERVVLSGTDVGGIDIRVQRNRAYKITGIAIDASGAPIERAQVNLVTLGRNSSSSSGIEMLSGGRFVAKAVIPGDYAIYVEIGSRFNPEDKRERELGYVPIRIDSGDVEGVVVTTARLAKVAGRVVFEDGAPEKRETMRVSAAVTATTVRAMSVGPWPSAEVGSDSTFELTGLFGPQTIAVTGLPPGWVVRSVKYRDEDVTDLPVEFKTSSDPAALEIALTRRGAVVSGRVLDAAGKGTSAGYVLLISADPARRRSGVGLVKTARPKSDGAFTLGAVRAGEYIIAASTGEFLAYAPFPDADALERVAQAGERLVLVESEKREIDLRVVKPQ